MRTLEALQLPHVVPKAIDTALPTLRMVDPRTLCVDEAYQRGLSGRSVRLISKIVAEWDWRAFKPPVVVEVAGALEVIDGQHTVIGAVTHGGIAQMPVLVIVADRQDTRAASFVRHNRDRIQVTPSQLHGALVAAGDEDAVTLAQVCDKAGVRLLRNPPPMSRFSPGDSIAIVTIRALINRRHAMGARKVLEICVKAGMAPVSAAAIRAVEHLLYAKEYAGEIDAERITLVLSAQASTLTAEAERFATERQVPQWRALASVIFMNRRKVRHAAA